MIRFEKRSDGQVEFFGKGFSKPLDADLKVISNPHSEGGAILIASTDNPDFDRNAISFDFAEVDLANCSPALSSTDEAALIEDLNTVFFNTVNVAGGGGGLPYTHCAGFIRFDGSNNPVMIVKYNDTGLAFSVTRLGTGTYQISSTGGVAQGLNKLLVLGLSGSMRTDSANWWVSVFDKRVLSGNPRIQFQTVKSGVSGTSHDVPETYFDDFTELSGGRDFEIRIYS